MEMEKNQSRYRVFILRNYCSIQPSSARWADDEIGYVDYSYHIQQQGISS